MSACYRETKRAWIRMGGGEELRRVRGGKIIIKVSCMKKKFSIKQILKS